MRVDDVLEVDAAHAPQWAQALASRWLVVLNVSRDQLDRYGEVAAVARLLARAAGSARGVVLNADDPRLDVGAAACGGPGGPAPRRFGVTPGLRPLPHRR